MFCFFYLTSNIFKLLTYFKLGPAVCIPELLECWAGGADYPHDPIADQRAQVQPSQQRLTSKGRLSSNFVFKKDWLTLITFLMLAL